ncbi:anthranilate phosphoribosyltransferase [Ferroplasma sp.]|uniref:anthranilate phosphoribosyltransferase n=1 Tax=Ferroplasma sp. TaxID=2591003 RepID=UPI00307E7BE6
MNDMNYTAVKRDVINARNTMYELIDKPDSDKIEFLTELHNRGESPQEIAGFAMALREMSKINLKLHGLTDIVGTGGDGKNTVNVSTGASILLASMGIKTAKHGNFGITGHHGSADFMKYMDYNFKMSENEILENIKRKRYVYILAPEYNSSFAKFLSARKQINFRTVFNILGPLTNPLNPDNVVLGTYSEDLANLYAQVIMEEGKKGFVVHGSDGMDEISLSSKSILYSVDKKIEKNIVDPEKITGGIVEIERISTEDSVKSFELLLSGLSGKNSYIKKFIAINAAPAVILNGMANSIEEAYDLSINYIENGKAIAKLREVCQ